MRWLAVPLLCLLLLLPGSLGEAAYFPASQGCPSQINVSQTGNTDYRTFTNGIHICLVALVTATAQNVNVIAGAGGTACATSPVALMGGTTAATGFNLQANGGFVLGTGIVPVSELSTTGQHLCVVQSGSGQVSGIIRYVDQ